MDGYRKVGLSLLPRIVEIAASVLTGTHEDDGLKRRAVLLLVACTRMNVVHREFAFQVCLLCTFLVSYFLFLI